MKRRLKTFNDYKEKLHESFTPMNELEDELVSDDLVSDDTKIEDTADDSIESDVEDETSMNDEEGELGEVEDEEDSALKMKINDVITENYKESLKDIFNGVVNELEEEEGGDAADLDDVIDYILDSIGDCFEEFATAPEETEGSEEGLGDDEPLPEEGSEEETLPEEGSEDDSEELV